MDIITNCSWRHVLIFKECFKKASTLFQEKNKKRCKENMNNTVYFEAMVLEKIKLTSEMLCTNYNLRQSARLGVFYSFVYNVH